MSLGIIKKDITADLAALAGGQALDFDALRLTDETYNIRPMKIMVMSTTGAVGGTDVVGPITGQLRQEVDGQQGLYQLTANTEYDLAFRKIYKTGTTTLPIFVIGEAI